MPLFYYRGAVYLVNFLRYEAPRKEVPKYAVCLQQGKIVTSRDTFTAVIMNSCKDNKEPRLPPWSVYVSPGDSQTEFGAVVNCSEIHTIPKDDIIDQAYTLPANILERIDRALAFGIGLSTIEQIEERMRKQRKE